MFEKKLMFDKEDVLCGMVSLVKRVVGGVKEVRVGESG